MGSRRLTTAQALVEFLKNQYVARDGVEHRLINGVFGIFGHGNVAGIGQALEEYGGRALPYYQPKNEQSMVHTAIAFAKARRGLGTFACTTSVGPGATNMVTGAATATINRLPVLLLPGDIFANRKPNPVLQQLEYTQSMDVSVNDCFKPVSKYWDRINRPEQIIQALPEAMRVLATPELMGAVTIALPEDVQAEAYDFPVSFFEKKVYLLRRPRADEEMLMEAGRLIKNAKRPFMIAGGGLYYSQAEKALEDFVERTHIPVGVTQAGKSILPDNNPYNLGSVGATGTWAANLMAQDADLVIAVGTRLSDFTTASKSQFKNPQVKFLSININDYDAHKQGACAVVGDAQSVLKDLLLGSGDHRISESYEREIMAARENWQRKYNEIVRPQKKDLLIQSEVIRIFNENTDEKAVVVHAAGGLPGDLHKLWRSKSVGDYHSEYGYSCMGYEIAGSLGVKMAQPEREVYAFLGDGSYLMLNHEIVTSIQEGLKITVLMNDNHGYQCIHGLQKSCGSSGFGNEFRRRDSEKHRLSGAVVDVDFLANARSLGAKTFEARNEKELVQALREARQEKSTCFIYVAVDPAQGVPGFSWWDVPVAEVSQNESVKKARERYEKALQDQRLYY